MGRHLFRRKVVILRFLVFAALVVPMHSGDTYRTPQPEKPLHPAVRMHQVSVTPAYEIPLQSHAGPKAGSLVIPMNAPVERELRKLTNAGGKKWISVCLDRAVPYRSYINSKIREHGLPVELLYLPIVESTYVPTAVSRSGAAGLWQFMMNSISPSSMVVNEWVDERFDFWKSTDASLRKLKDNYTYFGDWSLALAAYNCGLGKMSRIIKDTGIRDFWTLEKKGLLPQETAQYVPKFYAVVLAATNLVTNGMDVKWNTETIWKRIPVKQAVNLAILAETAGVPIDILRRGNAELRYDITPPEGSMYFLKVPEEYAENVQRALSDPSKKLLNFYIHVVQSGDTLSMLSRHFGVSVSMIVQHNSGVHPDRLKLGQKLIVPALRETGPLRREINVEELKTYTEEYTVVSGDTLWSISRKFGTTPEKLAAANGIQVNTALRQGMALNVPVKTTD